MFILLHILSKKTKQNWGVTMLFYDLWDLLGLEIQSAYGDILTNFAFSVKQTIIPLLVHGAPSMDW